MPPEKGRMGVKSIRTKRSRRARLVVVCATPEVRRRLVFLAKELPLPLVVVEAQDCREARISCLNKSADIILLDSSLPFADGLMTTQVLRDKVPSVRIVLVASPSKRISLKRALRVGANRVLRQNATLKELADCLHPLLAEQVSEKEDRPNNQRQFVLTKRELEILHLIDSRLKNKDIGDRLSITEGTVKIHVHAILAKLGANSRREAVLKARNYGLMAAL